MKVTQNTLNKIRVTQPRLNCISNTISGVFHVCATIDKPSQEASPKITYGIIIGSTESTPYYLNENFYIETKWKDRGEYIELEVFESSGKLVLWKKHIPPEYWHVNCDGSLCLGTHEVLNQLQQRQGSFEKYFYDVISQYFYQLAFVKKFGFEPWKTDRHGIFKVFELALAGNDNKDLLYGILFSDETNWRKLLSVIPGGIIKGGYRCPFCLLIPKLNNKQSKNCRLHNPQIDGFNKLKTIYSSKRFKEFCSVHGRKRDIPRDNPKNASVMKTVQ